MAINLQGRNLLNLKDFSTKEIHFLLDLSTDLKKKKRSGTKGNLLLGKNIALLFDKPSTRTRCAFEVAVHDESGHVTFLSNTHMQHKESIEDTAKVLGRMYDGIEFRGYDHTIIECLAKYAGVPVWNGLTDQFHPTQILADFVTLRKYTNKTLRHTKLVFVGDTRNNIGHSLMIGCAKMGMHFLGLAPQTLWPNATLIETMRAIAAKNHGSIEFQEDIQVAVKNADAIYTDVWFSMGEEERYAERIELLLPYQVNQAMLDMTHNDDVLFMHCLPAFHDLNTDIAQKMHAEFNLSAMEVTDEVFRGQNSVVFEQAENRLHTIKAVMVATIGHI